MLARMRSVRGGALCALAMLVLNGCVSGAPAAESQPAAASSVASPEPTASAAPADDLFCEEGRAGYEALIALFDASDAKSAQTGADGGGSVATMNEQGAIMLEAAAEVAEHWARARDKAAEDGEAIAGDFDAYLAMLNTFTIPDAEIAASSASIEQYSLAAAELVTGGDVIASATAGATGLEAVLRELVTRCGIGG